MKYSGPFFSLVLSSSFFLLCSALHAQTVIKPRFTVCSQNLKNYGPLNIVKSRVKDATPASLAAQEKALVSRFMGAQCDVIAVQEIVGKTDSEALTSLNQLASALTSASGREFTTVIASTGDGFIRNGMLLAKDRTTLLQAITYQNVELPKLMAQQKPRFFERPPLEVQIEARLANETKLITFVVYHLKSRANAKGDATALSWETYRMEMAEALRSIVLNRHKESFQTGNSLLFVLGDRNANFDLATAKILEGQVTLNDFRVDGPCRLSKRGVPICKIDTTKKEQKLFSVLTLDPETKLLPGTFVYKQEFSWLDDISVPAPALAFARAEDANEGNYDSFVVRTFDKASDHALVGVRLQWE